ncbi:trigger factor [Pseudokineococcus marinus]|uniref:Trigger factor n=1 Tax=Pseudokineococcus marinus TaxID=351215 RepID=A0A849BLK3_9ACTN|nr:trigger factor [Pseudokineococcus marinus]NNH22203.1 trigger factor [Pseudokineococcus marinus]
MKSAVETLTPTRVKLTVEVPLAELKPSLDKAYKEIGQQVTVPGFRRGKVPPRIIDQRVGRAAVLQEAVNDALPEFYSRAAQEQELRVLGQPSVEVTEVPVDEGSQLAFTAEVDVRPTIDLPDYASIEVSVDDVEVSEEDVTTRLDALRARFGTLTGVERPVQDGDFLSIDIRAEIDGEEIDTAEGISYQVGAGTMLDGTDEAVTGLSAGEQATFTAPLAGGDRAGQEAQVTVTVQSVKERQLPEADDDFAQMASEFDTAEELLADLREQARKAAVLEQGVQARDKVLEVLRETVEVPVPEALVEAEVQRHLESEGRLEDDEHRAEVTEQTQQALRTQLLLDAVVEAEAVQVSQEELVEYLVQTAPQMGMEPSAFAQAVQEAGQVQAMVSEVARRKGLAVVLEGATITDASGNRVDLSEDEDGPEATDLDEPTDAAGDLPAEEAPAEATEASDADGTTRD